MLNTAAKQSPGKDANTFMLITEGAEEKGWRGGKKWRDKKGLLVSSVSE